MMKTKLMSIAIAGALGLAAAGANAGQVWSPEYEEFIDMDFQQTTIATTTGTGSSELVYSDNYEEFVPGNQPRHVVEAKAGSDSDELIYRAEYEAYVPKSLNTIVIGS
jgi:hypothetical protein